MCKFGKTVVKVVAVPDGLVVGTEMEPIGFHRMNDADFHVGHAARHNGVDTGEVIFDMFIFRIPRGLIADGRGIVTLRFAAHGDPEQMRYAAGHAECCLPVPLELVAAEVEIPVGDAVKLACNAGTSVLMHRTLCLLGRVELAMVAEHIDARERKAAVAAHCVSDADGLRTERWLIEQMSGH